MEFQYDEKYFAYQKQHGAFAAEAMAHFFQPYISDSDKVLDFGCGGGFLLKKLTAAQKKGIEINATARFFAKSIEIETVADIQEVDDNWADVIISSHALEHTLRPYDILCSLKAKLREGGTVVFIVPHETKYRYNKKDENMHLYTWSEQCIGNLFTIAGYDVIESKELVHRFPPGHQKIVKRFGWKVFHWCAHIYGIWARYRHMTQVRIIARKR